MAFIAAIPEILGGAEAAAGAGEVAAGAAEVGGAGRLGGALRDFNDGPVGRTLGSRLGRSVVGHAAEGAARGMFEPHSGETGSDPSLIGPMGQIHSDI